MGKEIVALNELVDAKSNINGFVYSLSNGGYIITKKSIDNNCIVLQASFEGVSPYATIQGEKVYLGLFSYYEKNIDGTFKDIINETSYKREELTDHFNDQTVAKAISKSITGTVDSYVASGLQNFLAANTNFTAWVKFFGGSSQEPLPNLAIYKTFIDAGYPVLVTYLKVHLIVERIQPLQSTAPIIALQLLVIPLLAK